VTLEKRISRAERMLKMFARSGRKCRNEFREKIDILINYQIDINEQLKRTDEQLKRTDEQIEALVGSQAKTEKALQRFLDGLNKGNGSSTD
jgi:predicted  nucleic acid-binding Zn-ribbon protein